MQNGANGHPVVLVVEDDPEINQLVGAYAEIAGFTYRSALDGATALREVRENVPSAVVLDLMLPDMDGFEICRRIKSDDATRKIPVIILTALGGEEHRKHGQACGASEYLVKPFDPDTLMAALARHATTNGNPASRG
jgi:DNA-binding response OmpR family regulator